MTKNVIEFKTLLQNCDRCGEPLNVFIEPEGPEFLDNYGEFALAVIVSCPNEECGADENLTTLFIESTLDSMGLFQMSGIGPDDGWSSARWPRSECERFDDN